MVKKRQQDFDTASTKATKVKSKHITQIRDTGKVKKSSQRNGTNLAVTARTLLFSGSRNNRKTALKNNEEVVVSKRKSKRSKTSASNSTDKDAPIHENSLSHLSRHMIAEDSHDETLEHRVDEDDVMQGTVSISPCESKENAKGKRSLAKVKRRTDSSQNSSLEVAEPVPQLRSAATRGIQESLKALASASPTVPRTMEEEELQLDEGEESEEHYQAIYPDNAGRWIIVFTHRLELRGLASVEPFKNEVMVHGHIVRVGCIADTYAPLGYHNSVIENLASSSQYSSSKEEIGALTAQLAEYPDAKKLTDFFKRHPSAACIRVKELSFHGLETCLSMLPLKWFPDFVNLTASLSVSNHQVKSRYGAKTRQAVDYIVKHYNTGSQLKVVVCGSKDMGKSTLLRYIVNALLSSGVEAVAYLDCDPGQCEFTPSGCLSLRRVTQPLLGPPWCQVSTETQYTQLFGASSADADPVGYMTRLRKLVKVYNADIGDSVPLVVNTMGWKQDLGLQLLAGTIAEVLPTHLIQLGVGENSYKNFPLFSMIKVIDHDTFLPKVSTNELMAKLSYEIIQLVMDHTTSSGNRDEIMKASLSRDLMMAAYLSISRTAVSLHQITPYRVSIADVAVDLGLSDVTDSAVVDTINMTVMALCHLPSSMLVKRKQGSFCKVKDGKAEREFVGFGLIRAIDLDNQCLYVVTPVLVGDLSRVNTLVSLSVGGLSEHHVFSQLTEMRDHSHIPYLNACKSGIGLSSTGSAKQKFRRKKSQANSSFTDM